MLLAKEELRIVFRVDASIRIGTGHVMRCLTLAAELAGSGFVPCFVCRAHKGHMADAISQHGFELVMLPAETGGASDEPVGEGVDYASWLGAPWKRDALQTAGVLTGKRPCWVIVDHYAIDARWERQLKVMTGAKVMAIDGLANRIHDCDLLLDPTCSPEGEARWDGLLPLACRKMVGPQYGPLRSEFVFAKQKLQQRDGKVRRIFVAFGGVDEFNATSMVLDALDGLAGQDLTMDVVIGGANPHRAVLLEKYQGRQGICLHIQPANIAELMANADLAVSAGGTMLLEQCFMELPSIVASIAENQVRATRGLHELGAVLSVGEFYTSKSDEMKRLIRQHVLQLLAEPERLAKMQTICRQVMMRPDESLSQILHNLSNETN